MQMEEFLKVHKCTKCRGELIQRKKGTLILYCENCGTRHKVTTKKRLK